MPRAATALSILGLMLLPSVALAKPRVSLTLASQATAGAPTVFSYTTAGVPAKAKVVVQRQMGTARHYGTVLTLAHAEQGSGSLPAVGLGKYNVRIAVLAKVRIGGRLTTVAVAQQPRVLLVFGEVPFSRLFGREAYTQTTPSRAFSYTFYKIYVRESVTLLSVSARTNTCRSVGIEWITDGFGAAPRETGTLSLVQESRDPVSRTSTYREAAAIAGAVVPGQSWGISIMGSGPNDDTDFYVNGTASCYTSSFVH
jgi:hypothetical protein